jgi:hypothetical protein
MASDIKDSYAALSPDEPDENVPLQSDSESDEHAVGYNSTHREYRSLIKQLLIILGLSILFTIVAITIIVTTGSANCQTTTTMMANSMAATTAPTFSKPQPDIS